LNQFRSSPIEIWNWDRKCGWTTKFARAMRPVCEEQKKLDRGLRKKESIFDFFPILGLSHLKLTALSLSPLVYLHLFF
jgi:hypothetical protein